MPSSRRGTRRTSRPPSPRTTTLRPPTGNGQPGYDNGQGAFEEQQARTTSRRGTRNRSRGRTTRRTSRSNGGYPEPAYASRSRRSTREPGVPLQPPDLRRAVLPTRTTGRSRTCTGTATRLEYALRRSLRRPLDVGEQDRVGFSLSGTPSSAPHALTHAGLPARGSTASGTNGQRPVDHGTRRGFEAPPAATGSNGDGDWRTSNDNRWGSAPSSSRSPKAAGSPRPVFPAGAQGQSGRGNRGNDPDRAAPRSPCAPEDIRGGPATGAAASSRDAMQVVTRTARASVLTAPTTRSVSAGAR